MAPAPAPAPVYGGYVYPYKPSITFLDPPSAPAPARTLPCPVQCEDTCVECELCHQVQVTSSDT